jgi:hypothetical protein
VESAGRRGEALESVFRTGELWYEPEVLRIKAEILQSLPQPDLTGAGTCLEQAHAVSRARGARFWELRSAIALAKLLARQDRQETARRMLTAALDAIGRAPELPEVNQAVSPSINSMITE